MSDSLQVFLHGVPAGRLTINRWGRLSFTYDDAYCEQQSPVLSVSMPLHKRIFRGRIPEAFFFGLLPEFASRTCRLDRRIRARILHANAGPQSRYYWLNPHHRFTLLGRSSRECAGALSLHPAEKIPAPGPEILNDANFNKLIPLDRFPSTADEISPGLGLSGFVRKAAVRVEGEDLVIAYGARPSTHILKLFPDKKGRGEGVNQVFCMRLARAVGFEVPSVELRRMGGEGVCVLMARYDRTREPDGTVQMLHQEDFCQALGFPQEQKHQRRGGPPIARCLALLREHSMDPDRDQMQLLRRLLFCWLIDDTDFHAKNFSLLWRTDRPELAPSYDLSSGYVQRQRHRKMAMKIGRAHYADSLRLRHWHQLVPNRKQDREQWNALASDLVARCLEQTRPVQTELESEGVQDPHLDLICKGLEVRARSFAEQL